MTDNTQIPEEQEPSVLNDVKKKISESSSVNSPSGEAGVSVTFKLVDPKDVEHLVTFRGENVDEWPLVFVQAEKLKKMVLEEYPEEAQWRAPGYTTVNPVHSQKVPTASASNAGDGVSYHPVHSSDSTDQGGSYQQNTASNPSDPPDNAGRRPGEEYISAISKIQITPRPDGKIVVDFYSYLGDPANGRMTDYPIFKDQFKTAEEWVQLFPPEAGLNLQSFSKLGEFVFAGAWLVKYRVAKKRASRGAGNYYLNFVQILRASDV